MYFGLCELVLCAPHSAVSLMAAITRSPQDSTTVDLVHLLFEELMTSKEKEEIFHSNSNLHCEMK